MYKLLNFFFIQILIILINNNYLVLFLSIILIINIKSHTLTMSKIKRIYSTKNVWKK